MSKGDMLNGDEAIRLIMSRRKVPYQVAETMFLEAIQSGKLRAYVLSAPLSKKEGEP